MSDQFYLTERLDPKIHDRSSFICESSELETYLKKTANQEAKKRVTVTYVMADGAHIKGFYTLASSAINLNQLPESTTKKLPRYPAISAILLGRLAVHQHEQGHGLGKLLLVDALKRSVELSYMLGAYAVVVDAKNDGAHRFYSHFDFIELPDQQYRLFMPMSTIEKLF